MANYSFHPEALLEYAEATIYYLREAPPEVAERFVAAVESAVTSVAADPDRWRVIEEPGIRRFVFKGFPYVIYYQYESKMEFVSIFAVMHCSREPGYWRDRIA